LTDEQVKGVVDLLSSYNADPAVIKKVEEVLVQSQQREDQERRGASACGYLMRTLKQGAQGDDVKALQDYLQGTGDLNASSTGYFGPKTEEALKRFQKRNNIVQSGDPTSTGYGAMGPLTRNVLMAFCKEKLDLKGHKPGTSTTTSSAPAPSCTLTASDNEVTLGEEVTLTWTSENATYASTKIGGRGPTQGSIEDSPEETTTYIKRVYGPGGKAECTATVVVTGSTENKREMVWNTDASLLTANTLDAIGSSVVSAVTSYFAFFGVRF
jgi:peptidoglycan hydrolase-like protein with peptidoglycan-binding domain